MRKYELPQKTAVIQKLVILLVQLHLQLQRAVIQADLQGIGQEGILAVRDINVMVVPKCLVVKAKGLDLLALDERSIHIVVAAHKLNEISKRVPNRAIRSEP